MGKSRFLLLLNRDFNQKWPKTAEPGACGTVSGRTLARRGYTGQPKYGEKGRSYGFI